MGKDMGSWLRPHPLDGHQLSAPSKLPLHFGLQDGSMVFTPPPVNIYSPAGFPWVADSKAGQVKEHHGWFYCLPRFRHGLSAKENMAPDNDAHPMSESDLIVKDPSSAFEKPRDIAVPSSVAGCASKRFLVFDQTGDKTTLILSPGIGTPMQRPTSWTTKSDAGFFASTEERRIRRDIDWSPSGPNLTEELNEEELGSDNESEMREDTEEINALLYSDDESDYTKEDDEEVSTGHSPSTLTVHDKHENPFEEEGTEEEVASSVQPMKRQKLSDGACQIPLLFDMVSCSLKRESSADYEDDAQSSYAGGNMFMTDDDDDDDDDVGDLGSSLSGKKRSSTEKIRETLSILQKIIPDGKGKDAIMVIDETIHYLRSLKHEAESLGLSDL